MATFTKDRNILSITLDGKDRPYVLNLSDGSMLGLLGKPITAIPAPYQMQKAFRGWWNNDTETYAANPNKNLEYVLYHLFDQCRRVRDILDWLSALQAAEKLDAINAPCLQLSRNRYAEVNDNFKMFAKYIKDKPLAEGYHHQEFIEWLRWSELRGVLGASADVLNEEQVTTMTNHIGDITTEEWGVVAYYLVRGRYWEYHRGDCRKLAEYLRLCRIMGKKPEKVNNFMREFFETAQEYERRKTEYDNKQIVENYAKHTKAWEFVYGNHCIVIPTCAEDIIAEGRNMHHCVGGYVSNVVENSTYIVFVRPIDNPDQCYITAQVHTDGTLGQYYLAYDRRITTEEDRAFYSAFAEHLAKNWKN